jgi:hypothetical protein
MTAGSRFESKTALMAKPRRGECARTATLVSPRPASPPVLYDAGPLRLLRRWRQRSALALVRQPSGAHLAQVVVSAKSSRRDPVDPLQRTAGPAPTTSPGQDPPWLRRRERISLVKNRMRKTRTSGPVRVGDGDIPTYSAKVGCLLAARAKDRRRRSWILPAA